VLEHLGLVRWETDPLDARARMITLTGTGISRLESVQQARAQAFHELLAGWDINDLTTLTDLVARLNSGNADPTRTQTVCCANTSPKGPT
jgi:DNA-binding MarR family transcriptional regulator